MFDKTMWPHSRRNVASVRDALLGRGQARGVSWFVRVPMILLLSFGALVVGALLDLKWRRILRSLDAERRERLGEELVDEQA